MDDVIDDINTQLNSKFPTISEVKAAFQDTTDPDYVYIPDNYLRSVLVIGVASKWYEIDEEGNQSATGFRAEYDQELFFMVRDFSFSIPKEFQADGQGFVPLTDMQLETPLLRAPNNPMSTAAGTPPAFMNPGQIIILAGAPVYQQATTDSQLIHTTRHNTQADVIERAHNWVFVRIPNNIQGWVPTSFVRKRPDNTRPPSHTPTPPPPSTPGGLPPNLDINVNVTVNGGSAATGGASGAGPVTGG